jgi:aminoglycoside phosphotransferase (APT) family kinase protein
MATLGILLWTLARQQLLVEAGIGSSGSSISPTFGQFLRREVVERYEQRTGRAVPQPLFYFAFGLYKIGVIIQQIYARYRRGLTRDPRFARLIDLERALAWMAVGALDRGQM